MNVVIDNAKKYIKNGWKRSIIRAETGLSYPRLSEIAKELNYKLIDGRYWQELDTIDEAR